MRLPVVLPVSRITRPPNLDSRAGLRWGPWRYWLMAAVVWSVLCHADEKGGSIRGIVRYRPDPERPWRYSRYYVKDATKGFLAEAVVGLAPKGEGLVLAAPDVKAGGKEHHIDQISFQFVPETIAIRAGDSVRFTNSDDSLHNVMTNDGAEPFNTSVAKGEEYVHRFTRSGWLEKPVRIGCVFHGSMQAWIYVFDHPWYQVTGSDGAFVLADVPSGTYLLKLKHPAGRLLWEREVTIETKTSVELEIVLSPDDTIFAKRKESE